MIDSLRFAPSDPRVRRLNEASLRKNGEYVLYWSQVYRRGRDNAALAYAIEQADALKLPVLFYEAIRPDYPYASDRLHTFVLECARDTATELAARGIAHAFFLPRTKDEARGVVAKLAARAALVVSDDYPAFIVPAHNAAAAARATCPYFVVDDCAGVPLSLFPKEEYAARTLRPKLLRVRDEWIKPLHDPDPRVQAKKRIALPFDALKLAKLDIAASVAQCEIDHDVPPVKGTPGGSITASARLDHFAKQKIATYLDERNDPSREGTSGLSPYLHFGAISARRVALTVRESAHARGHVESAEAILEQLLVRRGLAYNFAARNARYASYDSIPTWAKKTLTDHTKDERPSQTTFEQLRDAESPDELWNAAQLQLRARGVIQGYARMLWGKLVMTWMKAPADAHAALIALNDRYALDGRDPDGWASISWCFGLHDRPWPERPIYGTVRSMTSKSARTKLDFDGYVAMQSTWRKEAGLAG